MSDSVLMAGIAQCTSEIVRPAPAEARTEKAVHEFEAILLRQFLEKVQESLTELGGDEPEPGSDSTQGLALDALANGISAGGGIGLAGMIKAHLEPPAALSGPTVQQAMMALGVERKTATAPKVFAVPRR